MIWVLFIQLLPFIIFLEFRFAVFIKFNHSNNNGIFLAMYYTGHVDLAFDSVEHIMREFI